MDVITVILIIVGSVFYYYVKDKLATDENNEQAPVNEVLPSVDIYTVPEQSHVATEGDARSITPVQKAKKAAVKPAAAKAVSSEKKPAEARISMKTKSEAKRAFIYSEIFNRKY